MIKQPWIRMLTLTAMLGPALMLPAQQPEKSAQAADKSSHKPDNTGANRADRVGDAPTADQAKNNRSDREIMQQIRKSIVAEKSLSTYAHNVKVIAEHGKVTLKGPVRSEEEKRTIEAKAIQVAGQENVTNNLTIKPDGAKKR
jgi:hyperosmotically inducible periplasmic protein